MPTITENIELKKYFLDNLSKMYDERERNGIHVSDLVYCLRKSFFRNVRPLPQQLSTLFYFLDGEQRHKGFQGLVPNLENEVEITDFGITGTMDLCNCDSNGINGKVIEIKTTRAKPYGQIAPHYLRQGAYYCLLKGTTKFTLLTQHINHSDIVFTDIEFNKEELKQYKSEMLRDRNILRKAYKTKSPDDIPLVNDSMKWLCKSYDYQNKKDKYCDYYEFCYVKEKE